MDLSLRLELDCLYSNIESSIALLTSALMKDCVVDKYCVYKVEKKRGARVVEQITSMRSAADVFSDFECISPDNSKETSIYPGYFALKQDGPIDEISSIVSLINDNKRALKSFLDKHNRPKEVHLSSGPQVKLNPLMFEAHPMKNPNQIFRELKMFNSKARMLHMKWTRKQRYDKHSIDSALRIIAYNFDKPPVLKYSTSQWQMILTELKAHLECLPVSTEIKRIKPAPSIPQIGVKFEGSASWSKFHGSLPLIFTTDGSLNVTAGLSDLMNEMVIDNEKLLELGWVPLNEELGFYLRT
ncbi:DNA replication terminus site-binding protein [Pseudoalteromonas lipolytica]|uniref:DNA replication terminus site-binding protein n=1 Tax=Pseudoalteromonas lipolytica TaxID=570156 RepID=UPI00309869A9